MTGDHILHTYFQQHHIHPWTSLGILFAWIVLLRVCWFLLFVMELRPYQRNNTTKKEKKMIILHSLAIPIMGNKAIDYSNNLINVYRNNDKHKNNKTCKHNMEYQKSIQVRNFSAPPVESESV